MFFSFLFPRPKKQRPLTLVSGAMDAGYGLEVERTGRIFSDLVLLSFCGVSCAAIGQSWHRAWSPLGLSAVCVYKYFRESDVPLHSTPMWHPHAHRTRYGHEKIFLFEHVTLLRAPRASSSMREPCAWSPPPFPFESVATGADTTTTR